MPNFSAKISIELKSNIDKVAKKISKATSKISKSTDKLGSKLSKVTSKLSKVGNALKRKIAAGMMKAGAAIKGAAASIAAVSFAAVTAGVLAVTAATTLATVGIVKLASHTLTFGDRVDKMSKALSVSTGFYQKFIHAGKLAGIEISESENTLKFFNKALGEAQNPASTMAKQFDEMGIKAGPLQETLPQVVDLLGQMTNKAKRTKLMMLLFGRAGVKATALLATSADELRHSMDQLTNPLDDDAIKASVDFNDAMTNLKATFAGLGNSMAPLFTRLTSIVKKTTEWMRESDDLEQNISGVVEVVKGLLSVAESINGAFSKYPSTLKTTAKILTSMAKSLESMAGFIEFMSGKGKRTGGGIAEVAVSDRPEVVKRKSITTAQQRFDENVAIARRRAFDNGAPGSAGFKQEFAYLMNRFSNPEHRQFPGNLPGQYEDKTKEIVNAMNGLASVLRENPLSPNRVQEERTPFFMSPTFNDYSFQ